MNKTKAIVISDKEKISYEKLDLPKVEAYEVLFHVKAASLCTIDKRAYLMSRNIEYPFLGGHECSGVIEEVGKGVIDLKVGDHAILTSQYCMQCHNDRMHHENICPNKKKMPERVHFTGSRMGGGFSEYLVVPCWQLIKINSDIPFEHACLSEPLACVVHSIKKADINLGDNVLIIGFGVMGYLHLKLALLRGARVFVSEPSEDNRKRALLSGASLAIDPTSEDVKKIILEKTNNEGCEVIINTIPTDSAWKDVFDCLATNGKVIAYSSQDKKIGVPVDFGEIHSKEYQIIGAVSPSLEDNDVATRLIEYGIIDIKEIIDGVFSFDEADKAFKKAIEKGSYRVVIKF